MCECWMSMASTCIQRKMEVKLEIFHCQTGNVSYFGFYMSLRNIRAYANIHIFCVGFYPDAGVGPSSSSFRPDNETFTLDDFDSLTPEEPTAQGDPDVLGYSQLGEDCLVQMCTDGMDGGRRFFKCPHAWVILGSFISLSSMRHLT